MKKFSKPLVACGALVATMGAAFAEGEAAAGTVNASLLTQYITDGNTAVVSILTAGAAIVGGFFIWGLIKKALRSSK